MTILKAFRYAYIILKPNIMKRLLLFSVLSIFCLTISAQTKTWVGPSGGSFDVASNWNPVGIPGSGNDVVIPTGSDLNIGAANVKSITIQGNSVASLAGNLNFTNASSIATNATVNWSSGALNGATINNNGTFNLSGTNSKGIDGNTMFVNNGAFNIDSDGLLVLTNVGHTFENTSSGVINLNAGGQITHQLGSGSGLLKNSGLIKKQQSSDGFLILAAFENDNGTIAVENGTLNIDSSNGDVPNAILTNGIYNVSSGETLLWNGGFNLVGTLTGQLDGMLDWKGTVNVLTGTEAIYDFDGPGLTWSNGLFQGDGTLTNMGIINLEGTQSKTIYGQSLFKNEGNFNMNSDGFLVLTNPSPTFNNTTSGVINLNAGGQITYQAGSGRGVLINSGLIKKQQNSVGFSILADFHNNGGTISVENGTLYLDTPNAILTNGLYNVTNGNTLEWRNVVTLEGTLTGQLDGQLSWVGNVNVPMGTEATLNFNDPTGFNWLSGSFSGDGTLINTGVLNLEGTTSWGVNGASILKNEGVINHNAPGLLILEGTSTLNNTTSGVINLNSGGQITYSSGIGTLLNSGLVKKQTSTDTFVMFATMNNLASGTFQSETGLLEFKNYAGTGTLAGNGSVQLPTNTVFEGTISPGSSPGILTNVGPFTASQETILKTEINGPNSGSDYDVFAVQGNAVLNGDIDVLIGYEANINDEFVILTSPNITSCNLPATVTSHYDNHDYTFDVICNPTNVTLKVTNIVLGTEENTLRNLSMYPNPSNGHFTIDLGKEYTDINVQIVNMLGQVISSEKYTSAKTIEKEITGAAGVYFVRVSTAKEGSNTLRIIKQ